MSCTPPTVVVGGITISTSDFVNATELLTVSGDGGDPTYDEYEGNIANGNNTNSVRGVQIPAPIQTTLPTAIPVPAIEENTKPAPGKQGVPVACPIWDGTTYTVYLSANFQLTHFTTSTRWPHPLTDYDVTYTKQVRFCNLRALAINVAEPLRAALGNLQINSGIRNTNSTATGLSQHVTGEAMDVQFTGWSYERYWDNAQWIKDHIPYDQFIFEHSDKTGLCWYHLSFKQSGNRASGDRTKVMTMYRNHYDSGLKRYG